VAIAAREPNILLNRTIGLGVEAPDAQEVVRAIASRYADDGIECYFLHLHPDTRLLVAGSGGHLPADS